jgi:multiple sugar transport system permease protein
MKSRDITLWFLSQRVLPPVVVLTPFYILLAEFGVIDTWIGLILLYSTFSLAFCVVIMRDIFRDVSKEVEEAARIEGALLWQIFWMIALALSLEASSSLRLSCSLFTGTRRFSLQLLRRNKRRLCPHSF